MSSNMHSFVSSFPIRNRMTIEAISSGLIALSLRNASPLLDGDALTSSPRHILLFRIVDSAGLYLTRFFFSIFAGDRLCDLSGRFYHCPVYWQLLSGQTSAGTAKATARCKNGSEPIHLRNGSPRSKWSLRGSITFTNRPSWCAGLTIAPPDRCLREVVTIHIF